MRLAQFHLLLLATPLLAETDDFSDNEDDGWIRFDPISLASGGGAAPTIFDASGGTYRIAAPGSPDPAQLGPARAVAFRPTRYTDFAISVDIPTFDDGLVQAFGIVARVGQPLIPGQVDGYALTYHPADFDIQITRVENESPIEISPFVFLDDFPENATLRLVFMGVGDQLTGRIFDVGNPLVPLAETSATDATYASGICGLTIFDNTQTDQPADATFDNYTASDPSSLQLTITSLGSSEWGLTWLAPFTEHRLESSADLNSWMPLDPDRHPVISRPGGTLSVSTETAPGQEILFYRLARPVQPES